MCYFPTLHYPTITFTCEIVIFLIILGVTSVKFWQSIRHRFNNFFTLICTQVLQFILYYLTYLLIKISRLTSWLFATTDTVKSEHGLDRNIITGIYFWIRSVRYSVDGPFINTLNVWNRILYSDLKCASSQSCMTFLYPNLACLTIRVIYFVLIITGFTHKIYIFLNSLSSIQYTPEISYRHGRIYIIGSYLNMNLLTFLHMLLGWENNEFDLILIQFQHVAVRLNINIFNASFEVMYSCISST